MFNFYFKKEFCFHDLKINECAKCQLINLKFCQTKKTYGSYSVWALNREVLVLFTTTWHGYCQM